MRPGSRGAERRALRAPCLQLLAAGALLFVAARTFERVPATGGEGPTLAAALDRAPREASGAGSEDEVLFRAGAAAVSADDAVVRLRLASLERYLADGGTAEDGDLADDASRLGLAAKDVVLRRWVVEATRLALTRPPPGDLPDEAALRATYDADPPAFASPSRLRARHVYLSRARHGAALRDDAVRLLAELRARDVAPGDGAALGDPFVRGATLQGSRAELERSVGPGLAAALEELPLHEWQGPLASPFGLHLVWVEERTPAGVAPYEDVRGQIAHRLLRALGDERARTRIAALRSSDADASCEP